MSEQQLEKYARQLGQLYCRDQALFGTHFTTTYPFEGTLEEMSHVMHWLSHWRIDASLANAHQRYNWILGILHLTSPLRRCNVK